MHCTIIGNLQKISSKYTTVISIQCVLVFLYYDISRNSLHLVLHNIAIKYGVIISILYNIDVKITCLVGSVHCGSCSDVCELQHTLPHLHSVIPAQESAVYVVVKI